MQFCETNFDRCECANLRGVGFFPAALVDNDASGVRAARPGDADAAARDVFELVRVQCI